MAKTYKYDGENVIITEPIERRVSVEHLKEEYNMITSEIKQLQERLDLIVDELNEINDNVPELNIKDIPTKKER